MGIIYFIVGIGFGGICIWFIQKYRFSSQKLISPEELELLRNNLKEIETSNAKNEERCRLLQSNLESLQTESSLERTAHTQTKETLAKEKADRINSEIRVQEQKAEFEQIKDQLKTDFENLANSILEEKSVKFTKQNQENLDTLLTPLKERINEFKDKVEKTYDSETRDRVELKEQIKNLSELNIKMSQEANNLTNALKGQSKVQGNWGELILETILERSGLVKNEEYLVQESFTTEDGKRSQPDVIINLPERKHFVIDSKVSLVAYERFCSNPDQEDIKNKALKEHLSSVRNHFNSLSRKNYQDLYQISAPDFVLMFIPIDPALFLACQNDTNLFMDAFEKGIFLVSPSTLIFALRTVANIWKREKQNRNALEIAKRSGDLYDKFAIFHDQLLKLGALISKTQDCYTDSMNKLKTGKGNLLKRIEVIKKLGARASKSLPASAIDEANETLLLEEEISEDTNS